jgi:predicted esterase
MGWFFGSSGVKNSAGSKCLRELMKLRGISRWLRVVGVAAVVFLGFRFGLQLWADRGLKPLVRYAPPINAGASNLIVVVHAYKGSIGHMDDVRAVIEQTRPDAEILMVEYPAGIWSNADCFQIASNLCAEVNRRYEEKHYQNIEYIGYSMGALLARKSYVYACGKIEDQNEDAEQPVETREGYAWATNGTVKRFVLFAGMNRGWSIRNRPAGMSLAHQIIFAAGKFIGWATGTGKLIRQCETGEPFVANLRLQWLEACRGMYESNSPTVVQLLGDVDDVVSSEDSRDANVAKKFIWVQLAGTDHFNATRFNKMLKNRTDAERDFGRAREEKFKEALSDEANERLRLASPRVAEFDDKDVTEAVIVLHGIRDFGEWTSEFENELQKRFRNNHPRDKAKLCIYRPKYGYFPMGRFLLWPERQKKVRWFMDELTELQARYPELKRIHFIGHSNGTYILASALCKYKALKSVGRVVFAGSVLPQKFDWTSPSLSNRVERVRSYAGSTDWVVGWFPRLFEIWPIRELFGGDIGSAGFNGFTKPDGMKSDAWKNLTNTFLFQTSFVEGAHGTAIQPEFDKIDSIAAFIMETEMTNAVVHPRATVQSQSGIVAFFSVAAPLVWILIAGVLALVGILLARLPKWLKRKIATRSGNPGAADASQKRSRWLRFFDDISVDGGWMRLTVKTEAILVGLWALLILFMLLKY